MFVFDRSGLYASRSFSTLVSGTKIKDSDFFCNFWPLLDSSAIGCILVPDAWMNFESLMVLAMLEEFCPEASWR